MCLWWRVGETARPTSWRSAAASRSLARARGEPVHVGELVEELERETRRVARVRLVEVEAPPERERGRGLTGGRGRRRFGGAAGEIDEDPVPEPGVDRHDRLEPEVAHRPFEDHGARDDDLRAARLEPCAPLGDRLPG